MSTRRRWGTLCGAILALLALARDAAAVHESRSPPMQDGLAGHLDPCQSSEPPIQPSWPAAASPEAGSSGLPYEPLAALHACHLALEVESGCSALQQFFNGSTDTHGLHVDEKVRNGHEGTGRKFQGGCLLSQIGSAVRLVHFHLLIRSFA